MLLSRVVFTASRILQWTTWPWIRRIAIYFCFQSIFVCSHTIAGATTIEDRTTKTRNYIFTIALSTSSVAILIYITNATAVFQGVSELGKVCVKLEKDASAAELRDLDLEARSTRRSALVLLVYSCSIIMQGVIAPILTGEMPCVAYPMPSGPALKSIVITAHSVNNSVAIAFFFLVIGILVFVTSGSTALFRVVNGRMAKARGRDQILAVVKNHVDIISAYSRIESTCSDLILAMVFSMLAISLISTLNVVVGGYDVAIICAFLMLGFYIVCKTGDLVTVASDGILDAIYNGAWLEEGVRERQVLFNVMGRCAKPACIRIGTFGMATKQTFLRCLRSWYSYLNLMINFYL